MSTAPATPCSASEPWWPSFLRRGLRNQLVCLVIATVIWLLDPSGGSFAVDWIYSVAIGTSCWFFIDGSRIALSHWVNRHRTGEDAVRRSRWPGVGWMMACIAFGTLIGYSLGSAIGDAITGHHVPSLLHNGPAVVISLIAAVAASYYFYSRERLHQEQAAADEARRMAAEHQLKLLESQLEPHMLFNTLANLRVLIGLDPARAQAMLDHLIAFLRATLQASRAGSHPLGTEFDRLADYLALMAVRMGPRLQVRFDLPDALRALPVPPLLLQPLVENCIKHGLEPKVEGGRIEIGAAQVDGRLRLTVRDTGIGLATRADGADAGTGFGTTQVRERLAAQYGTGASLRLTPAGDADGGTLALIDLPLPVAPA